MSVLNIKISQKTKRGASSLGFFILIVLVILLMLTRLNIGSKILGSSQFGLITTGTYISKMFQRITTSEDDLHNKIEELQSQVSDLMLERVENVLLRQHLNELEYLLAYSEQISYKSTAARVIARSHESRESILIDKGSNEGIREGLAVVIESGHIVGVVSEVKSFSSVVTLISDIQSSIPAAILGDSKTIGIVEGQKGYLMKMEFIPQGVELNVNDVVVTSGLDEEIPSGFIIGLVSEIIKDETALFQQVMIEALYTSDDFLNVLVIDPVIE
ncbi:MAG: rod shape-determining protein MreC [Candidatus Uhrbacteria bacterium]|nr:rod shape-determining protein MreC [Candidatus Uhrbacteria bacterium]